ncbi:MAG: sulfatase-like hydrolase/transferase [Candidatus Eisenbacteria bacterium]|uniref:Sulfatase-like hydrolase/transferase n=1 Tax=Eiseniibacteriota bacterium TaxID=2212470 RepID=A0A948RVH8_UNCEI|nr:sulfatase-like hydrolase/transferase [Candidatus Eisenbacteria bacterium]MBU1947615.1 sulfatase-like hydrolase/transferase [Candidatus Eisenbacteria bacterium]MBU2690736.1 sulfatase-like hydrolase/transferase [Candidatus Eisenbacteria bacterium]
MRKKILPTLFITLALAVGGWGLACQMGRGTPPQINVLLITLDTTRADYLGIYGHDKPTSPNIDKLAEEAAVFDCAIAQAAVTPVSHASILTGLNPYNHRLRVLHGLTENVLEEDQTTLADFWKNAGGQASAFVSAFPVSASFGLDQGFDPFDQTFPQADGEGVVTQAGSINTGKSQRRADATTDAALDWLQNGMTPDKPFFMWVHYFDPHDTLVLPPQDQLDGMLDGPFKAASEERKDILRAIYNCEIHYMDEQIGRLFDAFKNKKCWETTMIVVVADHGEGLGDHNWWSHGLLYAEQIRVPLLIKIPGALGGKRIPSLVRTIDLMPTILQAAGIEEERWPAMDGESLIPTMQSGHTPSALTAYSESVNIMNYGRPDIMNIWDRKDDKLYCLTTATGKLIYHQLKPEKSEFYNLINDPHELANLIGQDSQERDALTRTLQAMNIFSEHMPGMTATDLERARRLKGLGYIE